MNQENYNIHKVLLDVNVCVDLIANRLLASDIKRKLLSVFHHHDLTVCVPAFSIDTIFYVLTKSLKIDGSLSKLAIQKLLLNTVLLHTNDEIMSNAFLSTFNDFEVGLINEHATYYEMDCIITSNMKDFKKSDLAVYSPNDFISLFN